MGCGHRLIAVVTVAVVMAIAVSDGKGPAQARAQTMAAGASPSSAMAPSRTPAAPAIPAPAMEAATSRHAPDRLVRSLTPSQLSPECAAKPPAYEGPRAFRRLHLAMQERRAARVLAIGSSSIVGVGASKPSATFTEQLEADLERAFRGTDFDVIGRGMSGEVAAVTANRVRAEALQYRPDLIVWQVGTNDGVTQVDTGKFSTLLTSTLRWLANYRYDVVLIDPQYASRYAGSDHYRLIVRTVHDIARREQVPLVHRYDAMEDLMRRQINRSYLANDLFHLNDLGYKCMAEFAAQAIEVGVMQAMAEGTLVPN